MRCTSVEPPDEVCPAYRIDALKSCVKRAELRGLLYSARRRYVRFRSRQTKVYALADMTRPHTTPAIVPGTQLQLLVDQQLVSFPRLAADGWAATCTCSIMMTSPYSMAGTSLASNL